MNLKNLFIFTTILLLSSCIKFKDVPEGPVPEYSSSMRGRDIVFCKINGENILWDGKGGNSIFPSAYRSVNMLVNIGAAKDTVFEISCSEADVDYSMYLYAFASPEERANGLPELNVPHKFLHVSQWDISQIIYDTDFDGYGCTVDTSRSSVTFTRYDNSIRSGVFTIEADCEDTKHISVTKGFFDVLVEE